MYCNDHIITCVLLGGTTLNNNRPVCMCVYTGEKKYVKQMTTPAPTLKHQVKFTLILDLKLIKLTLILDSKLIFT